ncbi:uncharacterized protein LOC126852054 isoform X1 [Cataglyphis hispanica]|uniref:uncharacterized protein LOC126852054 isoform X1 n=1 Tax=Cataglyphis hispanica TaxID=1086592 RepID=UPI0021808AA0|nr:uncharacterized protein LOC126852054 isoform X1 [Cataglyphis hispanica]
MCACPKGENIYGINIDAESDDIARKEHGNVDVDAEGGNGVNVGAEDGNGVDVDAVSDGNGINSVNEKEYGDITAGGGLSPDRKSEVYKAKYITAHKGCSAPAGLPREKAAAE